MTTMFAMATAPYAWGSELPPTSLTYIASDIPSASLHGAWSIASDPTSPNGVKLVTTDTGFAQTDTPLAVLSERPRLIGPALAALPDAERPAVRDDVRARPQGAVPAAAGRHSISASGKARSTWCMRGCPLPCLWMARSSTSARWSA